MLRLAFVLALISSPSFAATLTVPFGGTGSSTAAGARANLGAQATLPKADGSHNGYLSSADWLTFNASAGGFVTTARSISTTSPLQGGGDLTANRTLSILQASALANGYLSSIDWTAFNTKQAAGSYLTALTGDVTAAGPGSAPATVALVGGSTAALVHNAELLANAATSAATPSRLVYRDVSGNFAAGTITANLTGNASGSAASFTGSLIGDVTGTQGATAVATVGGVSASNVASGANVANAATNANTISTIVKRDSSGNFSAGTITASITGHASSDEPTIAAGTTGQYWRGDKTWQTLDTSVTPENANLYFTNARARAAFSATSPLVYDGSGGYSLPPATAVANGYLASGDWTTFNAKQAALVTSAQTFAVSKDVGNDANDCSLLRPCKTIGAAVTAANAVAAYLKQAIIYVSPPSGSTGYGEDVTLSQQGVNLQCGNPVQNSRACLVKGSLTVNLTGTAGGANFLAASNEVYVNGMIFSTASATALTFSGTAFQRLALVNSYIESTAAGGFTALSATNSGTSGGTASTLSAWDTQVNNSSASNPTISQTNGRVWFFGTQSVVQNATAAGHSIDLSGTSSFVANLTAITGEANITDNTANVTFNLATIASGSNPCVVTPSSPSTGVITLAYFGCTSTATNSVTGSGVVVPIGASTRLSSSGDIISTVTQAVLPGFPQGEQQIGAGATTGTNVLLSIKGGHVKITQATAPTAAAHANAGTSATCSVSNASDSAGKLSLTTGSGSWASGTQCTVTFNKAYGVAPICTFSPTGANAAANAVTQKINFPATSTTAFTVNFGTADTAGTAYTWTYNCTETQ